jgi:hypothetical protein
MNAECVGSSGKCALLFNRSGNPPLWPTTATVEGYWRFEGGERTVPDSSGHGLDGQRAPPLRAVIRCGGMMLLQTSPAAPKQ